MLLSIAIAKAFSYGAADRTWTGTVSHTPLKRARLPIPPRPHSMKFWCDWRTSPQSVPFYCKDFYPLCQQKFKSFRQKIITPVAIYFKLLFAKLPSSDLWRLRLSCFISSLYLRSFDRQMSFCSLIFWSFRFAFTVPVDQPLRRPRRFPPLHDLSLRWLRSRWYPAVSGVSNFGNWYYLCSSLYTSGGITLFLSSQPFACELLSL